MRLYDQTQTFRRGNGLFAVNPFKENGEFIASQPKDERPRPATFS